MRDGVPDDVVYAMTTSTLRRSDLASVIHPTAAQTKAGNLKANTVLPVQPGVQRFYREAGMAP